MPPSSPAAISAHPTAPEALDARLAALEAKHAAMEPSSVDNGVLDAFMTRIFGRSYRTTIGGIATFGCGVVVVVDQFVANPLLHTAASVCTALGLVGAGAVGVVSKDARVSGLAK